MSELVTTREAASMLGVSRYWLIKRTARGDLEAAVPGGKGRGKQALYDREDIEKLRSSVKPKSTVPEDERCFKKGCARKRAEGVSTCQTCREKNSQHSAASRRRRRAIGKAGAM